VGGRCGWVAERACDDIGRHILFEREKDYSRQDGKDGPNTEAISDGSDPGVVVVVPKIVNVPIPEIGRCSNSGRHGVSATATFDYFSEIPGRALSGGGDSDYLTIQDKSISNVDFGNLIQCKRRDNTNNERITTATGASPLTQLDHGGKMSGTWRPWVPVSPPIIECNASPERKHKQDSK